MRCCLLCVRDAVSHVFRPPHPSGLLWHGCHDPLPFATCCVFPGWPARLQRHPSAATGWAGRRQFVWRVQVSCAVPHVGRGQQPAALRWLGWQSSDQQIVAQCVFTAAIVVGKLTRLSSLCMRVCNPCRDWCKLYNGCRMNTCFAGWN